MLAASSTDTGTGSKNCLPTPSRANPAFNPIGYHTGSVWTHDSAIAALGLARAGHPEPAVRILRGLLDAATFSGFRLPELYGDDLDMARPVPCPASCRPQAWAAPSAAVLVAVDAHGDVTGCTAPGWLDVVVHEPG